MSLGKWKPGARQNRAQREEGAPGSTPSSIAGAGLPLCLTADEPEVPPSKLPEA